LSELLPENIEKTPKLRDTLLEITLAKSRFNLDRDSIHGSLIFRLLPELIANSGLVTSVNIELIQ
jgi:hypothetical protein